MSPHCRSSRLVVCPDVLRIAPTKGTTVAELHAQKNFGQHLPNGDGFYGDVIAVIDDAASKPQAASKKKGG